MAVRAKDSIELTSTKPIYDDADMAKRVATDTNQYFWHHNEEGSTENGAHVTEVPQEEFLANPQGGNTLITSNGLAVRDGTAELAQFTRDRAVIGENGTHRIEIQSDAITGYNAESVPFFQVDFDGGSITEKSAQRLSVLPGFEPINPGPKEQRYESRWVALAAPLSPASVTWSGTWQDNNFAYISGTNIYYHRENQYRFEFVIKGTLSVGAPLEASFIVAVGGIPVTAAFALSVDNGGNVEASVSLRAPELTYFHAWDDDCVLTQNVTTTAPAFVFGTNETQTKGLFSATLGKGLDSTGNYQLVAGKYNEADSNSDFVFIAGNGADDSNRTNALAVSWGGDVEMALDDTASSGDDFAITDALTGLGWTDCIV